MAFTNDDYLPSFEELKVPELNLTTAPLKAGSHYLGKYCDNQSRVCYIYHNLWKLWYLGYTAYTIYIGYSL